MLISSPDQLRSVVAELADKPSIGFDLETTGLLPAEGDRLCMASLYHPDVGVYAVPFRMSGFITNLPERTIHLLQPLLDNCELTGHNVGPFDVPFLRAEGMDISRVHVWDTLLGSMLWNDSLPRYGLEPLCVSLIGSTPWKAGTILTKDASQTPPDLLVPRAEQDAIETWQLRRFVEPAILERGDPYPELLAREMRWALFLGELSWVGLGFDINLARRLLQRARKRAFEIEQGLWARWRPGLKINSPAQLLKFFEGRYGIKLPSTEDWVLRMEARPYPGMMEDVEDILEWRKWDKEIRSWLEPWIRSWTRGTGRVRGQWGIDASNEAGRATGMTRTLRLRCSKPNLQAVPVDDQPPDFPTQQHRLRCTFRADGNNVLVGYDYSQGEIRIGVHYAKEKRMLEELSRPGGDIHQMVADDIKLDRYRAKRVALGTQYNIGQAHLAEVLTRELLEPVLESETGAWLRRYRGRYPRLRAVNREAEQVIQRRGYLRLWNGRRAHFNPEIDEPHKAFNLLVQMGMAELLKSAVFEMLDFIAERGLKTRIILCVYDEIITETPPEELEFVPAIKQRLESIGEWRCPLVVDTWHRKRWSNKLPQEISP